MSGRCSFRQASATSLCNMHTTHKDRSLEVVNLTTLRIDHRDTHNRSTEHPSREKNHKGHFLLSLTQKGHKMIEKK